MLSLTKSPSISTKELYFANQQDMFNVSSQIRLQMIYLFNLSPQKYDLSIDKHVLDKLKILLKEMIEYDKILADCIKKEDAELDKYFMQIKFYCEINKNKK